MSSLKFNDLDKKIAKQVNILYGHLRKNLLWMICSGCIILTVYGYELFNMNLTIDEELTAFSTSMGLGSLAIGRWGEFLLTKYLIQKQIMPFIPLAVTIFFHLIGILLFLSCFEVQKTLERVIITALGLTWPGLAYLYSFSNSNFAVGFGFLCISLSLFILIRFRKATRLLAAVPISFVLSVYQPLLQPLAMVFLLYMLHIWQAGQKNMLSFLFSSLLVIGIGYLLHIGVQQLFLNAYHTELSGYVPHYFEFSNLFQNLNIYIQKLWRLFYNVMAGDVTFYGIAVRALPLFLIVGGASALVSEFKRREKFGYYLVFLLLLGVFCSLPFIGGILTKGYIPYRSLLGLPIFLMGCAALALKHAGSKTRILLSFLAVFTLFQFASSMNHLFASSAFAYEEDKFLAGLLVQRIEEEKAKDGLTDVAYLELVGYVDRPSTPLVSRIENIGASFFGWDGGHTERVVSFLKVLGYNSLEALPLYQRTDYVIEGVEMPAWPANDSVRIVGDVVMVKFSSYSNQQIKTLCATPKAAQLPESFCPLP